MNKKQINQQLVLNLFSSGKKSKEVSEIVGVSVPTLNQFRKKIGIYKDNRGKHNKYAKLTKIKNEISHYFFKCPKQIDNFGGAF